jgi:hypothetical protein
MKTVAFVFAGTLLAIAVYMFLLFFTLPFARVTVKVLDEAGNPVPNATVRFSFVDKLHSTWGNPAEYSVKTKTNAAGVTSEWGPSEGTMPCDVQKDGYYQGWPWIPPFNDISFFLHLWLPWNPKCVVVLKRILNPIPMYAQNVDIKMPAMNQPIGFDLAADDWVQPFGKGITSDFIFTMSQTLNGPMDFNAKLLLTFANEGDGLQVAPKSSLQAQGGSRLKFPRNAPQVGYVGNWTTAVSRGSSGYKEDGSNGMGYLFQVRTKKTAQGEIQSADYGKIDGDICIMGAATHHPRISFTYYFNPTGTTNLEADPSKNLFKNLDEFEAVKVQYP